MTWGVNATRPEPWNEQDWSNTAVIVSWPDTPKFEIISDLVFEQVRKARVPFLIVCDCTLDGVAMNKRGEDWLRLHDAESYFLLRLMVDIPNDIAIGHGKIAFRRVRIFIRI
jgi:hypothetical protein